MVATLERRADLPRGLNVLKHVSTGLLTSPHGGRFADTVLQPCWAVCSRNGLKTDRWAYVAKVLNILVYEVCSNRELVDDKTWRRLQQWLHLPLDSKVFKGFAQCVPAFAVPERLKGLSQREYFSIQRSMRAWARSQSVPPIWLEDYYSSA